MLDIPNLFAYHSPTSEQIPRYKMLRTAAREFAEEIDALCPDSAEKTLAIQKAQEAVMWANASIAINT